MITLTSSTTSTAPLVTLAAFTTPTNNTHPFLVVALGFVSGTILLLKCHNKECPYLDGRLSKMIDQILWFLIGLDKDMTM